MVTGLARDCHPAPFAALGQDDNLAAVDHLSVDAAVQAEPACNRHRAEPRADPRRVGERGPVERAGARRVDPDGGHGHLNPSRHSRCQGTQCGDALSGRGNHVGHEGGGRNEHDERLGYNSLEHPDQTSVARWCAGRRAGDRRLLRSYRR